MSLENELLTIEREPWTGGADSYRRNLDDDCLVAFTKMAGVSTRGSTSRRRSRAEAGCGPKGRAS